MIVRHLRMRKWRHYGYITGQATWVRSSNTWIKCQKKLRELRNSLQRNDTVPGFIGVLSDDDDLERFPGIPGKHAYDTTDPDDALDDHDITPEQAM